MLKSGAASSSSLSCVVPAISVGMPSCALISSTGTWYAAATSSSFIQPRISAVPSPVIPAGRPVAVSIPPLVCQ